jgi:transcriptional regulator with XRE-family HTH domain
MLKTLSTPHDKLLFILNKIRAIRKSRNYTQAYMAKILNISRYSYNRKETGNLAITLIEFFKIAEILKVDPTGLIEPAQIN